MIGTTVFCASVGFAAVGLALPFAMSIEVGFRAVIGLISSLIGIGYNLLTKWRQWQNDVDNVLEMLRQIKTPLENICKELIIILAKLKLKPILK